MIAFTLALAFGWALHHPAPTLITTGIAAAFAVLALAAWYADRPERHPGRHVLADPDAETITVIHQMHEELHHEDPFGAAYLTAPLADMGPAAGDPCAPVTTATCPSAEQSLKVDSPAPADPDDDLDDPALDEHQGMSPQMAAVLIRADQIKATRDMPLDDYLKQLEDGGWEHSTAEFAAIGGA